MASRRKETHIRLHFGRSVATWSAICVLPLSLSGCSIGAIFALFAKKSPTVTVAPEYELPAGKLLIFVDSPPERTGLNGVGTVLNRELAREITAQSLAPSLIPPGELATLRVAIENFRQLEIAEIGR